MKSEDASQEKINMIQVYEQNLHQLISQKQNFQAQLTELDSSLSELGKSKDAYKIIGNIMVKTDSTSLKKEISDKKEMFEVRVRSIEKQEEKLKEKISEIQKEVMKEMKK